MKRAESSYGAVPSIRAAKEGLISARFRFLGEIFQRREGMAFLPLVVNPIACFCQGFFEEKEKFCERAKRRGAFLVIILAEKGVRGSAVFGCP